MLADETEPTSLSDAREALCQQDLSLADQSSRAEPGFFLPNPPSSAINRFGEVASGGLFLVKQNLDRSGTMNALEDLGAWRVKQMPPAMIFRSGGMA